MKKLFFTISVLCVIGLLPVRAQQTPVYTQYMFNPYIINPALAGTHLYYQIRSSHRFQWVGISDAPITNAISIYGPHTTKDMGFGGYIYSDIYGPSSQTGFMGTYAYNIAITTDIRISGGLSVGLMQYKVDLTEITLAEEEDLAHYNDMESMLTPDAKVGIYLYSTNYHIGFSFDQLVGNKLLIDKYDIGGIAKLSRHFYIIGGYKYFINRDWAVEPTFLMKKVVAAPFQADISVKGIYQNMVWTALSFRTMDAMSLLVGYIHNNKMYIGYSYDLGVNPFRKHHTGSHEVMIGYKFDDIKK